MRSEAILVKNEGELIPQSMLEKVLSNNTSSIGCAIWHPEKCFIIDREPVGTTLKEMLDHQNDCKSQKAIYWFCESVSAVAQEDLQPFTIIGDKDDEGVVAFCIGAFSMKNDGQFSDAYVFAQKYLKPKLNSMFKAAGEDLDKLAEMLASEEIKTDMELAVSPNKSTVAIMLAGGKNFLWSEADRSTTDKWGFVSDNYGLKETVSTEAPKSDPTPRKRFGVKVSATPPDEKKLPAPDAKPGDSSGAPAAEPYRPFTKPDDKVAAIHKGPTASDLVAAGAASPVSTLWVIPNPDMGAKKTKDFYKAHNHGIVPDNWAARPPLQLPASEVNKMSRTRAHIVDPPKADNKTFASALAPIASTESLQQQKDKERIKDTEAHHIPKPVVSPVADIKKASEVLQASKAVQDPKDWEALENKYVPLYKRADPPIPEAKIIFADEETRDKLQDVLGKREISRAWMHSDFKYMEAVQYAQSLQKKIDDLKAKYEPAQKQEAATAEQPKTKRFGIKAAA